MSSATPIQIQQIPCVCPLSEATEVQAFGGKAHHLAQMLNLNFPVLPGFVVTDRAFQEFLESHDLRSQIAELCDSIELKNPASLQRVSQAIRKLVVESTLPVHVLNAMDQQWQNLPRGRTLIVRSSAVGEDSHQASFAGQLDSILNVRSKSSLEAAVLACWASYWSERSLFYQRRRGIFLEGMGVLVQEQAESKYSGVLFTVSPDHAYGGRESMVIEYCPGLGTALVSGEMNPGRILVRRGSFAVEHVDALEESSAATEALEDPVARSVAEWGLKLEELFGRPQDIEWTLAEDGQIYLLQSRDISAQATPSTTGSFNTQVGGWAAASPGAMTRSVLWSNANVNENFPDPICPLLYSIASVGYYHYFRNLGIAIGLRRHRIDAMEHSLQHIIGVHGARMYYNLSSIHASLRMAPYGERLTELFNNFVGADRVADRGDHPDWQGLQRGRIRQFAELCRIAVHLGYRGLSLSKGVARFEFTADAFAAETAPQELRTKSLSELLAHLRCFIDIRCNRWVPASLADAAAMLSYGMLKRFLNDEFPDGDLASLHNTLLKGLPDLASNQPVIGLWTLSRHIQQDSRLMKLFAQHDPEAILHALEQNPEFVDCRHKLAEYLEQCGFRCSGELMLTVPSFQERPADLIEILKAYVTLKGESPEDRLRQQEVQRQEETARIMQALQRRPLFRFLPWPAKALQARILLKWTQRSIALRERARLKQALLYNRLRRIALAIGDQLLAQGIIGISTDLFFLSYGEIDDLLSGSTMFPGQIRKLIQLRRTAHNELSQLNPPDTFELPEGHYFTHESPLSSPADKDIEYESSNRASQLYGVGACGGSITAPAAILKDVSEFHRLSEGDVLVTRQTDPGWGPLFFLIKGLVIERGGMLSHGAILAREYGIPTVVGVPDATKKITQGLLVTVNGDRGIVQLPHD